MLEDPLARAFERLSRISFERLPNLQAYEIRQPDWAKRESAIMRPVARYAGGGEIIACLASRLTQINEQTW